MRSTLLVVAGTIVAGATACSSGIKVSTSVAPDANLVGLHTFHVMSPPSRRADAPTLPASDPMLDNSITNQQLRKDLQTALTARGYAASNRQGADFLVAYYAGTKQKFDTTYWGPAWDPAWRYRYWGRSYWAWPWSGGPLPEVAQIQEYTQGQLIVDVIDPRTNQLLWRGQGVAQVSDDPAKYGAELDRAVNAIIKKFPQGSPAPVAGGSQ
jgi:hypothetical protein